MNAKFLAVPAVVIALAAGAVGSATASQATAPAKAKSSVTIKASGVHLSGKITSPKKASCASGRSVVIVMQMGARGNDMAMGRVTANRNGSWSASPGMAGKYYAIVKATSSCAAGSSKTVRAHR